MVQAVIAAAEAMLRDDVEANRRMGAHGADALAAAAAAAGRGSAGGRLRVLTHCNTGSLATAAFGTALGVIRTLHEQGRRGMGGAATRRGAAPASRGSACSARGRGAAAAACAGFRPGCHTQTPISAVLAACRLEHAYCCETRPYNQGSRLTAYELITDGLPATLLVDSAAAALMAAGKVDAVVVGADRIAANGGFAAAAVGCGSSCGNSCGGSCRRSCGSCGNSCSGIQPTSWSAGWPQLGDGDSPLPNRRLPVHPPGDTANKIGTYCHAVAAAHHSVPFFVAAPTTTLDPELPHGGLIPIEQRDPSEARKRGRGPGARRAAAAAAARSPCTMHHAPCPCPCPASFSPRPAPLPGDALPWPARGGRHRRVEPVL